MTFSAILVGHETLTRECGEMLRDAGHRIVAVVSRDADVRRWAEDIGLLVYAAGDRLDGIEADWLISAANLDLLGPDVLARARRGAVNFHDGPLPRHAGLNAPVWALIEGERTHGIAWHLIEGGVDEGDLLVTRDFEVAEDETALTLNARCFAAALESFAEVMAALELGAPDRRRQDLSIRTYHARDDRPAAGGALDFGSPVAELLRLVRALDHGEYRNPLALPKVLLDRGLVPFRKAEAADGTGAPGTVLSVGDGALVVACADGALRLAGLTGPLPAEGDVLPTLTPDRAARIDTALRETVRAEPRLARQLASMASARLPLTDGQGGPELSHRLATGGERAVAAFAHLARALTPDGADTLARATARDPDGVYAAWTPLALRIGRRPCATPSKTPLTRIATSLLCYSTSPQSRNSHRKSKRRIQT